MAQMSFPLLNKVKTLISIATVASFVALGLTFVSTHEPAYATSTAAVNVGATSVRVNQANNLGITLSGFSTAEQSGNYQVTLKYVDANGVEQSNGSLSATQGSTSLITGYNSYTASKLGFKGTYQAIQTALSTVTWTPASASSGLTLRIGLATAPGANQYYDANSGHYYEYVSTTRTWDAARTDAATRTLNGLNGYLVHITSRAENDFVANEASAPNVWIGASDTLSEGQWRWGGRTIPGESDFVFGTYSSSETLNSASPNATATGWGLNSWYANSSRYAGWANGEPNNWGGSEDCAVTNWNSSGQWNDLACSNLNAYLVEYGGAGGTLSTLALTVNANMGASDARGTFVSPSSPTSTPTQTFTLSFNYDVSGISSSDFVNIGTATGCAFTPSASSALTGVSINIVASGCSSGTLQPRLLENSVVVSGSPIIPAATATAITIAAGTPTIAQSTVTMSDTAVLSTGSPISLTITPRDSGSRALGTGKVVTVTSTLGTVSSVTDVGNGSYTATITPGNQAGLSDISVTADGTSISSNLTLRVVTPAVWTSPASPTSSLTQSFSLAFTDNISGIQSADFANVGTANNCVFTPSGSSATSGNPITVVASNCSTGTVQPRLLSSSVILESGLSLPAATASAVSVEIGSGTIAQSTISLSRTSVSTSQNTPITVDVTPRDVAGRELGAGRTVTVTSTLGVVSAVVDNGDGTYSAVISPGSTSGISSVTVSVDSVRISSGLEFSITSPAPVVSLSPQTPSVSLPPAGLINQVATPATPSGAVVPNQTTNTPNFTNVEKPITSESGQLPRGESGKALMLVNGEIQEIKYEAVGTNSLRASTNDGLFFEVFAADIIDTSATRTADGSLVIKPGQKFQISGSGFAPNTEVFIWLFSTPQLLSNIEVAKDGTISADVALKLGLPPGKHTLQVSGVHPDGTTRAVMLDVVIPADTQPAEINQDNDFWFWLIPVLVTLMIMIVLIILYRKKKSVE